MKINKYFDTKLADLLDRYSDTKESVGTNLMKSIKNATDAEMIIPVLGTQGMGKSTLINALLEENILPNDADETTCVPVEVKYGTDECAKVHFFDRTKVITIHTREDLNEYVDNNYNPANEKHVAYIELFRKNPLIQNGLVIVDLPGVGSLTKENEETTKRYVENLCSAIFVIPTVPTIRNKEAIFIKSLWSQFSKAIFVQNDWGETKEELQESVDFNTKVLKKIAGELHNPFDDKIIVVNAYNAVAGALQKNLKMKDESNIKALYDEIVTISSNWDSEKEKFLVGRIKLSIKNTESVILKRLSDLKKSKEDIEKENEQKINLFKQGTIELTEKIEALKSYLRDKEDEVYFEARKKANDCAKKIRAAIFKEIEGGVYDGEYLSQAFNDIQEEETSDFMNDIVAMLSDIKFEVEEKFAEIQQIEIDNEINIHPETLNSESKVKWEKGLQIGLNIGGGVAGLLGAGPLLAACGVAGPAGWVVGAVMLGICSVFSLFGWGVKKITQANRADKAKRQVSPLIDEIERKLIEVVPDKYNEFAESCYDVLNNILKNREEEEIIFKKSLNVVVDPSQERSLLEDLEYINEKQKEFDHV